MPLRPKFAAAGSSVAVGLLAALLGAFPVHAQAEPLPAQPEMIASMTAAYEDALRVLQLADRQDPITDSRSQEDHRSSPTRRERPRTYPRPGVEGIGDQSGLVSHITRQVARERFTFSGPRRILPRRPTLWFPERQTCGSSVGEHRAGRTARWANTSGMKATE